MKNYSNFVFPTRLWPSVFNEVINTFFSSSGGEGQTFMQPSSVIVTVVNVLNPLLSVDFNWMHLGTNSYILPLSINDGGMNQNFFIW